MKNVAGEHLAPCRHAFETFMKQHIEYYFFMTLNFSYCQTDTHRAAPEHAVMTDETSSH